MLSFGSVQQFAIIVDLPVAGQEIFAGLCNKFK